MSWPKKKWLCLLKVVLMVNCVLNLAAWLFTGIEQGCLAVLDCSPACCSPLTVLYMLFQYKRRACVMCAWAQAQARAESSQRYQPSALVLGLWNVEIEMPSTAWVGLLTKLTPCLLKQWNLPHGVFLVLKKAELRAVLSDSVGFVHVVGVYVYVYVCMCVMPHFCNPWWHFSWIPAFNTGQSRVTVRGPTLSSVKRRKNEHKLMKSLGDVGQERSKLELQCEWTCMNSGPSGIELIATSGQVLGTSLSWRRNHTKS